MRLLSKPAVRQELSGWNHRPSRTHRAFGCESQPTYLGKVEENEIRLRQNGTARFGTCGQDGEASGLARYFTHTQGEFLIGSRIFPC
jgi:hypothetical protein